VVLLVVIALVTVIGASVAAFPRAVAAFHESTTPSGCGGG